MGKDTTAFRERFNAYKNGKSVSEIYDAGLPKYDIGKVPEQVSDDVIDFIIKNEGGYTGKLSIDPGNGAESLDGINVKKYIDQFKKTGRWTLQDHRNAIREIVAGNRPHIRKKLSNYKSLTKDQLKALDDIVFNIGSLDASTNFVSAVLAGDMDKAKSEMDWGNNQKDIYGRPLRGLRSRNAARQILWGNATATPQQLRLITAVPDAVAVRPTIPVEQTVPAYDPTISPYISGKPMVKLRPRIELPNLMQLIEDSEWEPPFEYKNGKLPEYGGGLTPVAMPAKAAQNNNVVNGIMSYIPFIGTAMDGNDLIQGDTSAAIPFLIGTVADTVGGRSLYKAYLARKIFMDAVKQKLSTSQVYPLMIQANDKMNKALAGAAAYASDWYENTLQNLRK